MSNPVPDSMNRSDLYEEIRSLRERDNAKELIDRLRILGSWIYRQSIATYNRLKKEPYFNEKSFFRTFRLDQLQAFATYVAYYDFSSEEIDFIIDSAIKLFENDDSLAPAIKFKFKNELIKSKPLDFMFEEGYKKDYRDGLTAALTQIDQNDSWLDEETWPDDNPTPPAL